MADKKTGTDWETLFPEPAEPFTTKKPWELLKGDDGKSLVILVDGDIIAYRAAAPCNGVSYQVVDLETEKVLHECRYHKECNEIYNTYVTDDPDGQFELRKQENPEPENFALYNVDKIMEGIINHFENDSAYVRVFLTGNNNFRQDLYSEYKSNRDSSVRPVHLNACKQHLVNRYRATLEDHLEADDLLGINQVSYLAEDRESVIVSIDKDLYCIPGRHYHFVKNEDIELTPFEAMINFYAQVLTGDTVDNIPGIKGMGPKTAAKVLKDCKTDRECYDVCLWQWTKFLFPDEKPEDIMTDDCKKQVIDTIQRSAQLLWILHEDGTLWTPPYDALEEAA